MILVGQFQNSKPNEYFPNSRPGVTSSPQLYSLIGLLNMQRRHRSYGSVLLTGWCLLSRKIYAFVATSSGFPIHRVNRCCALRKFTMPKQRHELLRQLEQQDIVAALTTMSSSSWSLDDRMELMRGLVQWQEGNQLISDAGIKILTESSPTAVLTRYYESLAAGDSQQVVLVAPSCTIEGTCAAMVERALSSACLSRVYHPDAEEGALRAPHLALWHETAPADTFSPSSVLEEQTASLSQKAVMEEVFLWLQRTMLAMVDDEEEIFVDLGRKLLTVRKYVVANATTEADLSRTFWAEATALTKHGTAAAKNIDPRESGAVFGSGVGGGGDPREDSVLLALPGFRFKDRASFKDFAEDKLVGPLRILSPLGVGGVELFADIFAGEDLKFPVIILSPYLEQFDAPEDGYKFINGRGEEQDAEDYIRESERKLAQQAAERAAKQEQNPLFPSVSPPINEEDSDDEDTG